MHWLFLDFKYQSSGLNLGCFDSTFFAVLILCFIIKLSTSYTHALSPLNKLAGFGFYYEWTLFPTFLYLINTLLDQKGRICLTYTYHMERQSVRVVARSGVVGARVIVCCHSRYRGPEYHYRPTRTRVIRTGQRHLLIFLISSQYLLSLYVIDLNRYHIH